MGKKNESSLVITDEILKKIYNRLVNVTTYKKQLYEVNKNLGSFQEPSDYAQEVLICLNKKLKTKEVKFYSEPQLWTYCSRILNMLLLRQHRDYTTIKSRKGTMINIDNELESGKTIDDIVGLQYFDKQKSIEIQTQYNFYKNYIIAITDNYVNISHISKLFNIDKNARLINLYSFLDDVKHEKLKDIFKIYNIKYSQQKEIINSILEFTNISSNKKSVKNNFYSISTDLTSRDKQILKNLKSELKNKSSLSFKQFKAIVA